MALDSSLRSAPFRMTVKLRRFHHCEGPPQGLYSRREFTAPSPPLDAFAEHDERGPSPALSQMERRRSKLWLGEYAGVRCSMGIEALTSTSDGRIVMPSTDEEWHDWVSASATWKYMMKEPLLDWLDLYGESNGLQGQRDDHLGSYDPRTDFTTSSSWRKAGKNPWFDLYGSGRGISERAGTP